MRSEARTKAVMQKVLQNKMCGRALQKASQQVLRALGNASLCRMTPVKLGMQAVPIINIRIRIEADTTRLSYLSV